MKNKPISIRQITQELFSTQTKQGFHQLSILFLLRNHWIEVVGDIAARNSTPVALTVSKLLVIHCSTSSWVQELRGLQPIILERIAHTIPNEEIKGLKVAVARHPGSHSRKKTQKESSPTKRQLTSDQLDRINNITLELNDEELRSSLVRLFSRIAEMKR